jgi:hypothetical protein
MNTEGKTQTPTMQETQTARALVLRHLEETGRTQSPLYKYLESWYDHWKRQGIEGLDLEGPHTTPPPVVTRSATVSDSSGDTDTGEKLAHIEDSLLARHDESGTPLDQFTRIDVSYDVRRYASIMSNKNMESLTPQEVWKAREIILEHIGADPRGLSNPAIDYLRRIQQIEDLKYLDEDALNERSRAWRELLIHDYGKHSGEAAATLIEGAIREIASLENRTAPGAVTLSMVSNVEQSVRDSLEAQADIQSDSLRAYLDREKKAEEMASETSEGDAWDSLVTGEESSAHTPAITDGVRKQAIEVWQRYFENVSRINEGSFMAPRLHDMAVQAASTDIAKIGDQMGLTDHHTNLLESVVAREVMLSCIPPESEEELMKTRLYHSLMEK